MPVMNHLARGSCNVDIQPLASPPADGPGAFKILIADGHHSYEFEYPLPP